MQLSIIIPVYKVEKYIRDTLQSIYRQQYDENLFEVIVINDGTPDDSMRIVAEFTNKHANLHIINQKNQGLSCARNAGLKIAQGEYVWFVDSDDTVTEESIGKVIECIERSKADVIGFSILKVSEANRVSEVESAIWNDIVVSHLTKLSVTKAFYSHFIRVLPFAMFTDGLSFK